MAAGGVYILLNSAATVKSPSGAVKLPSVSTVTLLLPCLTEKLLILYPGEGVAIIVIGVPAGTWSPFSKRVSPWSAPIVPLRASVPFSTVVGRVMAHNVASPG